MDAQLEHLNSTVAFIHKYSCSYYLHHNISLIPGPFCPVLVLQATNAGAKDLGMNEATIIHTDTHAQHKCQ